MLIEPKCPSFISEIAVISHCQLTGVKWLGINNCLDRLGRDSVDLVSLPKAALVCD